MDIIDATNNKEIVRQLSSMLLDGFSDTGTTAWSTPEECVKEVSESLEKGKISRIAVGDSGEALGWTVGTPEYDGNVWELAILVVRRDCKLKGIGRKLVEDFEDQVRKRNGIAVFLGTDDENNRTSLSGIDLYPNPLEHAANIENLGRHPFEFYQKLGYSVTGIVPDANGFGKPDIYMMKRVQLEVRS